MNDQSASLLYVSFFYGELFHYIKAILVVFATFIENVTTVRAPLTAAVSIQKSQVWP